MLGVPHTEQGGPSKVISALNPVPNWPDARSIAGPEPMVAQVEPKSAWQKSWR
jgi:hypothetical protein